MSNKVYTPREYYFEKYHKTDPAEATKRTGITYDENENRFTIPVLNHTLYVKWPDFMLIPVNEHCPKSLYSFQMEIIIARYLIEGRNVPGSGQFKAYRDLPWGDVYDKNFSGRCIKRFANTFGTRIDSFRKAAEYLGGTGLTQSDAGYDFVFLPDILCRLLLWVPDEEFGSSAQFLFSDNIQFAFNAEDLAVIGDILISTLSEITKTFKE